MLGKARLAPEKDDVEFDFFCGQLMRQSQLCQMKQFKACALDLNIL